MTLEVTEEEREILLQLLEAEQKQVIQQLDHADSRDYKGILNERLQTLEGLLAKLSSLRIS